MTLTIDHTGIPAEHLAIALSNEARSTDFATYPWMTTYPLAGQTVYCEGRLWTVYASETGPGAEEPIAARKLIGCGHDDELVATRNYCRPVSWTQHDEDWLGRE